MDLRKLNFEPDVKMYENFEDCGKRSVYVACGREM